MKQIFALIAALLLSGCVTQSGREASIPPNLDTYPGLSEAIERGEDIIIYDVRTPEEYATGYIPGAINIPHDEIAQRVSRWKRNRVIIVYCASGGRSGNAYRTLVERGFRYVFDFGGIYNWEAERVTD